MLQYSTSKNSFLKQVNTYSKENDTMLHIVISYSSFSNLFKLLNFQGKLKIHFLFS